MKAPLILLLLISLMACSATDNKQLSQSDASISSTSNTNNAMNSHLTLPIIFADHMILQRDKPIKVWGWATANNNIVVTLASAHKSISNNTKVQANGQWLLTLPAQQSGDVYQLTVSDGEQQVHLNDILMGDVWLASGQSNMEWKLGWNVDNWQQEVATSANNQIRFFEIDSSFKATEQDDIQGGTWQIASPNTTASFSAVAWHFAKLHHADKKVPVAIIDSTWGGTPAEAWVSLPALSNIPGYQTRAKDMQAHSQQWQHKFEQNSKNEAIKWQIIADDSYYRDGKVLSASFDDSAWQKINLPSNPNKPLSDIVWLRKSFDLTTIPNSAEINLGEMNQIGKVFLNGQLIYEEDWQKQTTASAIPLSALKQGKNQLAIRVINSWDNHVVVGKPEQLWLKFDQQLYDLQGQWLFSNTFEPQLPIVKNYSWETSVLFNAMIKPITHYPIKGVIWYQGESNVGQAGLYANLFKGLIKDWRVQFKEPQLPFLFVQLASYLKQQQQPKDSAWAQLRQAQTEALSLANTGMAVTIDIGNADDIHPRNKADVGKRLWLAAKHIAFAEQVIYSGPQFSSLAEKTIDAQHGLLISYQHTGENLQSSGDDILGFAIAGQDNKFVNAQATIIGKQIFVYSAKIKHPKAVRYGWADNSPANITNSALLPAIPFQYQLP